MTRQAEPNWEAFYRDYRKPGFIPGYEILNKLGGGAFGIVFKARKESIGKDYAVKFLKLDEANMRNAVLRELDSVSLFAQIDHPNLVTIEDKGEVHGIPFILMGYAGEGTLRNRIDAGTLDRDQALGLFVQVARGLKALHDHALVHFDLKPANVFLRGDVARLGDYGLSKLISASHNSLSFGRGTPYYMAPELLQQRGDHRSDIYSLGVILFECLSGTLPFRGDSEWEILRHHEQSEPTFPASIQGRERLVIARCMAKLPEDRYQTVDALLEDLLGADASAHHFPQASQPTGAEASANAAGRTRTPLPPPLPPRAKTRHETSAERRTRIQRASATRRRRARPKSPPAATAGNRGGLAWLLLVLVGLPFAALVLYTPLSMGGDEGPRHASVMISTGPAEAPVPGAESDMPPQWTTSKQARRFGRKPIPALKIPGDLSRHEVSFVVGVFDSLRRGRMDVETARRQLSEYRRAAVIIGANELVGLDYYRQPDTRFCQKVHATLRPLTRFQFRNRSCNQSRISRSVARYNQNVAAKFRHYVASQYY